MEAVAGRIADLENAVDPLPDYLEQREADPAFTGFHRIEYGLWGQGSTEGLVPVAGQLLADTGALKERLRGLRLAPDDLAGSAARLADRLAAGQIAAGEDRWAGADLDAIAANLDRIDKGAGLLLPLVTGAAPDTAARYEHSRGAARRAARWTGCGRGRAFPPMPRSTPRRGRTWPAPSRLSPKASPR